MGKNWRTRKNSYWHSHWKMEGNVHPVNIQVTDHCHVISCIVIKCLGILENERIFFQVEERSVISCVQRPMFCVGNFLSILKLIFSHIFLLLPVERIGQLYYSFMRRPCARSLVRNLQNCIYDFTIFVETLPSQLLILDFPVIVNWLYRLSSLYKLPFAGAEEQNSYQFPQKQVTESLRGAVAPLSLLKQYIYFSQGHNFGHKYMKCCSDSKNTNFMPKLCILTELQLIKGIKVDDVKKDHFHRVFTIQ